MIPPPDAVNYEFDPHTLWAIVAVCVALFILILLSAIPIDDDPRKWRR